MAPNDAPRITVRDYLSALGALPPGWLDVDYQTFVQAFLGNILIVANGCDVVAYDKSDGLWKDPSRVGQGGAA